MTTKSYGAGTSGYLDAEGRAWETTIFQAGKPVLDKELNLAQDSEQEAEVQFRRRTLPSGWMADDFLNIRAGLTGIDAIVDTSATANRLVLANNLRAHVNGWVVRVANTGSNTTNILDLGAAPAGAGTKRTDLVILEVWRRLIAPSPSTVGKSPAARIWKDGNVKIAGADDLTLNYADDILDGAVAAETTKRVQIQYRLRVVQGVDVVAHPYGLTDPVIVARSVPTNAATPDGSATVFTYSNQSANGDSGLWRAGDGSPANTIGSVDGYIYAIPMIAVLRRNTAAFARNTNHNGGVASPGPSDRPDGLFYDIVDLKDIVDLRLGVSPTGWSYQEVMDKNFNFLLDNELLTEILTTPIGGGVRGHYHLWADEIGLSNAHGGDGTTTGDTPGAEFVGEFDALRRAYSDRYTIETVTLKYNPAGANWANSEVVTINPTALPIYPYAAFNWASFAPSNISFLELANASFIGSGGAKDLAPLGGTHTLDGLGTVPQTSLSLNIGTVPAGITNEPLYLRMVVAYPKGVGLSKTPVVDLGANGLVINNPGQLPAGAPVLYEAIQDRSIDAPHRELFLTYRTVTQTTSFSVAAAGTTSTLIMPERVVSVSASSLNGGAYGGTVTPSTDGYSLALSVALNPGDELTVQYKAVRPLPQNGEQITLFYYANAPQTAREALLGTSLAAVPRCVSNHLYSMTIGCGSEGTAYPFPQQYVQMPGIYPTSGGNFDGDHELDAPGRLVLKNFSTDGGFVKLPTYIPMVANPDQFSFIRAPGDVDAEGRSYFKELPASTYLPNAFAEPFAAKVRHRCVLPVLAELTADSPLGYKGQLVLMVLNTWIPRPASGEAANAIGFNTNLAQNVGSVSVYRIKGNLLNRRTA